MKKNKVEHKYILAVFSFIVPQEKYDLTEKVMSSLSLKKIFFGGGGGRGGKN